MNEIDITRLAFIFTILTNNSRSINIEYKGYDEIVAEFANDVMSPFFLNPKEKEKHYRKWFGEYSVHISIPDNDNTIENRLRDYIEEYSRNNVTSQTRNISKWEKLVKDFERSIDEDIVLSAVHIDSVEYLPVIVKAYFDQRININSITFGLDGDMMMADNENTLYIEGDGFHEWQYNTRFTNFYFTCSIDMTNYYNDIQTVKTSGKKPTLQDKMVNDIAELVNKRGLGSIINKNELRTMYEKHAKTKANDKDKQICNYVSDYRRLKAEKLTLSRVYDDDYSIIKNKKKTKENSVNRVSSERK